MMRMAKNTTRTFSAEPLRMNATGYHRNVPDFLLWVSTDTLAR